MNDLCLDVPFGVDLRQLTIMAPPWTSKDRYDLDTVQQGILLQIPSEVFVWKEKHPTDILWNPTGRYEITQKSGKT